MTELRQKRETGVARAVRGEEPVLLLLQPVRRAES